MSPRVLDALYLVNASLLVTHEIDSAYWNEWELLHLPGGIQHRSPSFLTGKLCTFFINRRFKMFMRIFDHHN